LSLPYASLVRDLAGNQRTADSTNCCDRPNNILCAFLLFYPDLAVQGDMIEVFVKNDLGEISTKPAKLLKMPAFQKIVITFTTTFVICVFRFQSPWKFFIQFFVYSPFCHIPVEHSFWVMMQ
jgi:hypothetical protein